MTNWDTGATPEEVDMCKTLVTYLLVKNTSRRYHKKPDLRKVITGSRSNTSVNNNTNKASTQSQVQISNQDFTRILERTSQFLKQIYGYELSEISNKRYVLILKDEDTFTDQQILGPYDRILSASISHIFMSGGSVTEDSLWQFLDEAGLIPINNRDKQKEVKSLFTKDLYWEYVKLGGNDNPKFFFKCGERADKELPKTHLLTEITKAYKKPIDYFQEQYKAAFSTDEGADDNSMIID